MVSEQDIVVLKQLVMASKQVAKDLERAVDEGNSEKASRLKINFIELSNEIKKLLKKY